MPGNKIAATAIVYPNVVLGRGVVIEDFCIIGIPPQGKEDSEFRTMIGDGAIIRAHTIIYAGNLIGKNFQTGNKANIRESNNIGNNVSVGTLSVIEHHVRIEDSVRIHSQAFIPEYCHLKKRSWVGPNVVLTNARYPQSANAKAELLGVVLEEGAKVGANSTILPGVVIGQDALVGAGSVVTKNVHAGSVVAGNPATVIKKIQELDAYRGGEPS